MGKHWSILFAVVMAACFGLFLIAPALGWWLPEGVSSHANDIDFLFYVILYITGFFFVLTEAILVIFMFNYAGQPGPKAPPRPEKSFYAKALAPLTSVVNTPHRVELAWTIIPAAILLWIAFAQIGAWAEVKYKSRMPEFDKAPLQIDVSARQFEWRLRYASSARYDDWISSKAKETQQDFKSFAKHPHLDDIHVVNELHVWKGQPVLVWLGTRDVIHSFNLPHLRVKQDALPGKTIPVWFTPTKSNTPNMFQIFLNNTPSMEEARDALKVVEKERTPEQRKIIQAAAEEFAKTNPRWKDGFNPAAGNFDSKHVWELACAELCGWGHYRMIGRIYVHETREDWLAWLTAMEKQNQGH